MDLVETAVMEAGGRIKRRGPQDFIASFPRKAPESLVAKLRGYGYHLFSSAPGSATGGSGRDYWFQRFRGTAREWQEHLRTGAMPAPNDPIGRLFGG